jgi:hypothetical protein
VLVTLQGYGSIWEQRPAVDPSGPSRFARTAYYNTTGVFVNGKFRPRWRIGGKVRFNAIGGFTPDNPRRSLTRVFECKEPELTRGGWTQVLVLRKLIGPERPDFHLFVVTAEHTGRIDIQSPSWKAGSVQVVALSQNDDRQEAMLLMPTYSWVRGELGTFYAEPSGNCPWSAGLLLGRAS